MYSTSQENFWADDFGDDYISRNKSSAVYKSKRNLFREIFKNIDKRNVHSIVELGANIGLNLAALQEINEEFEAAVHPIEYTAVEINERACDELGKMKKLNVINESILNLGNTDERDFVFTCGVLIHIDPASLDKVYQVMYDMSSKYICVCEYYNPTPTSIPYRGNEDKLFKRDFAGEMLDKFPGLKLVDYGFAYHRDPDHPLDDVTWFLLENTRKFNPNSKCNMPVSLLYRSVSATSRCIEGNVLVCHKDTIFDTFGFCGGHEGWGTRQWAGLMPRGISAERGFFNNGLMYNEMHGISSIDKLPIKPRQNSGHVLIDDILYILGGFSYTPLTVEELQRCKILPSKKGVYTYSDGVCCKLGDNSLLPLNEISLPIPISDFGMVYHKASKMIYIVTGCNYDSNSFNCNETIPAYDNVPIGCVFLRFSISEDRQLVEDEVSPCKFPGTPRFMSNVFIRDDCIYVIGGVSVAGGMVDGSKGYDEWLYSNVLDSWRYCIKKDEWTRLHDYPIAMSCQGHVLYQDKYAILLGGVSYNKTAIMNNVVDTSELRKKKDKRFPFNNVSSIQLQHPVSDTMSSQYNKYCSNMIVVYDTERDLYEVSDIVLPFNMSSPKAVIKDDVLHIVGGEANPTLLYGQFYGINLGCMLRMKVRPVPGVGVSLEQALRERMEWDR
jgi:pseudaminic acid biosynthesis-associated methylase